MHGTVAKRISNYRHNFKPQHVADTLTAKKEEMIARMTAVIDRQCQVEELTKGVLAGEPTITSIFIP